MTERKPEYTIINADSTRELIEGANELLSQGWDPVGGVNVTLSPARDGGGYMWSQAFIKPGIVI